MDSARLAALAAHHARQPSRQWSTAHHVAILHAAHPARRHVHAIVDASLGLLPEPLLHASGNTGAPRQVVVRVRDRNHVHIQRPEHAEQLILSLQEAVVHATHWKHGNKANSLVLAGPSHDGRRVLAVIAIENPPTLEPRWVTLTSILVGARRWRRDRGFRPVP